VAYKLTDPGPRHPSQVEQGDAAVSEVVRREKVVCGKPFGGRPDALACGKKCRRQPRTNSGARSARWRRARADAAGRSQGAAPLLTALLRASLGVPHRMSDVPSQ
jgi:hypothetical protein